MTAEDDKKLNEFQAEIDSLKYKHEHDNEVIETPEDVSRNMSVGMRAGTELVGSIMGGALIGYGLDRLFDSKPWLLIVFLILGIFTGFFNVWRTTQNEGSETKDKKTPASQK
jgi:ATP synthase protein I